MDTELVTLQVPASPYSKLQALASEEQTNPVDVLAQLVTTAHQRRQWLQDLDALRQQIQDAGGLQVGNSKEEIVARLQQTRQEIFAAEYAHLYR